MKLTRLFCENVIQWQKEIFIKMKKFFAIITSISILLCAIVVDAQSDYATRGEVCDMLLEAADFYNNGVVKSDILKGYEDGLLHEERPVTRAEALVMISRAFEDLPEPVGHNRRTALSAENFTDIPLWASQEMEEVFDSGIVAGTAAGIFSPDANVTKEQMKLFIKRIYSLYASNIRDDFYAAVNKDQLDNMEFEDGEYISGTIYDLQNKATAQMNEIIDEIVNGNYQKNSPEQKIVNFYDCIMDIRARNKKGTEPIQEYLERIDSIRNVSELALLQTSFSEEVCVSPFMNFSITVNLKDSTKYMLYFETLKPIMNKEVYIENDSAEKSAYLEYIEELLKLGGEDKIAAKKNAKDYFEFEKKLAENMLSAQEQNDIEKIYNTYSYNKLCAMFPDFDMEKVISGCGLKKEEEMLISDVNVTEKFASLYNQSNINELKTAAKLKLLIEWGETLSEDFNRVCWEFDRKILGMSGEYSRDQYAFATIQNTMADYLSDIYAQKYFDESSKKDVENMVYDIIEVFKCRIESLSWMSYEAKEKAKSKLDSMRVKIGYEEVGQSYLDDIDIVSSSKGGTYFENALAVKKALVKHYSQFQGQDVNRDMWVIYPYTVNACYDPAANDITFPAAILQAPLYEKSASYEENLGGIGYIIAHEITHAFDNNGALFDENGNLGSWWSQEDYTAFSALCEKVALFYDRQEAIPAVATNGQLTLSENVADLGAAACVTELVKRNGGDLSLLYTAMAKSWASSKTREYALLAAKTDTHADDKLRINCVLSNLEEFYETFDISEGDGMYVAPENRIKVW